MPQFDTSREHLDVILPKPLPASAPWSPPEHLLLILIQQMAEHNRLLALLCDKVPGIPGLMSAAANEDKTAIESFVKDNVEQG